MTGSDTIADVRRVYQGSDGDATKALYARLTTLGPRGDIAVNLFRACKASERAKVYRGGGHRGQAYERKQWAMDNLCTMLVACADQVGIEWGWGVDSKQAFHQHVLYAELPTGQVSFHTAARGKGPTHAKAWDGVPGQSADRICRWIGRLLAPAAPKLTPLESGLQKLGDGEAKLIALYAVHAERDDLCKPWGLSYAEEDALRLHFAHKIERAWLAGGFTGNFAAMSAPKEDA